MRRCGARAGLARAGGSRGACGERRGSPRCAPSPCSADAVRAATATARAMAIAFMIKASPASWGTPPGASRSEGVKSLSRPRLLGKADVVSLGLTAEQPNFARPGAVDAGLSFHRQPCKRLVVGTYVACRAAGCSFGPGLRAKRMCGQRAEPGGNSNAHEPHSHPRVQGRLRDARACRQSGGLRGYVIHLDLAVCTRVVSLPHWGRGGKRSRLQSRSLHSQTLACTAGQCDCANVTRAAYSARQHGPPRLLAIARASCLASAVTQQAGLRQPPRLAPRQALRWPPPHRVWQQQRPR